jgi:ubiquinone/menaquinone biosynthesis C-methylase UbiE
MATLFEQPDHSVAMKLALDGNLESGLTNTDSSQESSPAQALLHLLAGGWITRALFAVSRLGIADRLRDGPQNIAVLAHATGTDASALYRMLRTLASVGVFVEDEAASFSLTPMGRYLQTDVPGSLQSWALYTGEENYRVWEQILYSVQTGQSAFEQVFGMTVNDYRSHHPEVATRFNIAMTQWSQQAVPAIVTAYDFSSMTHVVDVGGGIGDFLIALLLAYPHLQGTLVELPHVATVARLRLESAGLARRTQVIAADFFSDIPSGGDLYILKNVLESFPEDRTTQLLQNCRRVMTPEGKLLVVGQLIQAGNQPAMSKLLDLALLVQVGGRLRTEAELRRLLQANGLQLNRIIPTQSATEDIIVEAIGGATI